VRCLCEAVRLAVRCSVRQSRHIAEPTTAWPRADDTAAGSDAHACADEEALGRDLDSPP